MKYTFTCKGHENILGTHRNTLEFSKDSELSVNGNCIVGVEADFEFDKLAEFLKFEKVRFVLRVDELTDEFFCEPNKGYTSKDELVIRLGTFESDRTFGLNSEKGSLFLSRDLMKALADSSKVLEVSIESL